MWKHLRQHAVGSVSLAALALLAYAVSGSAEENGPNAERVTVEYDRGSFRVLSRVQVRKVIPPSDTIPEGPVSGFYYELQSEEGVRYRRTIHDPITLTHEGPDIETAGSTAPDRQTGIPERRVFNLLIPLPQPGDELVLFGPPAAGAAPDSKAGASAATVAPATGTAPGASGELVRLEVSPPTLQ